ncbi:class I tRNA ligase family protein, partial [Candidatus Falkowbacteria bacterium]|nr:class I tRNA ligase family protein [Candidatus Falkowbacteria bacterium]
CETTRPTSPSSELDGGRAKMRKTNLTLADRWILSEMNKTVGEVTKGIEEFQFSRAGEILYEFTWTKLADWYLEVAKVPAYAPAGASADKESDKSDILIHILTTLLKLWHPFTPYVTEEIWGHLNEDMLMVAAWPEVDKKLIEEKSVKEFEKMQELVTKIRNMRAEKKIAPKEIIKVKIKSKEYKKLVDEQKEVVCGLGRCEIVDDGEEIRI